MGAGQSSMVVSGLLSVETGCAGMEEGCSGNTERERAQLNHTSSEMHIELE